MLLNTKLRLFAGETGDFVNASPVYCHQAGSPDLPALRGPVAQGSRSAHCLIHAENPRGPLGLALPVSGHSHSAAAQAKAVPAAAAADQLWVEVDQAGKAVPEEVVVVVVVDTRLQSHNTGAHSSNSR